MQPLVEELKRLFEKYLVKLLDFKKHNCNELIPIAEMNGVTSLCKLFDSLATVENGVSFQKLYRSSFMTVYQMNEHFYVKISLSPRMSVSGVVRSFLCS